MLISSTSHAVSVTPAAAGYLGTFTARVSDSAIRRWQRAGGMGLRGRCRRAAIPGRGRGTHADLYGRDRRCAGGIDTQAITITIAGTNDGPVITSALDSGAVTEDALPALVSGTIDFGDVDLTDSHRCRGAR